MPHTSVVAQGGTRQLAILAGSTDEQGDYELRVPAGVFLIEVTTLALASDRQRYATTYYPGVVKRDEAAALSVSVGDRVEGINIALLPSGVVFTGRVFASGVGAEGITVTVVSSPAGVLRRSLTEPDGSMRFSGLKAGRYVIFARARDAERDDVAFEVIDATNDVNDLTLSLAPAGRVRGRIVPPDGQLEMLDGVRVIAALMDGGTEVDPTAPDQVEVAPDGFFEIPGLFGERALRLIGLGGNRSTEVLTENGRPVDRFTIPSGGVMEVVIVLRKHEGHEGTREGREGTKNSSLTIDGRQSTVDGNYTDLFSA
jgi:hypothetical protein